MCRLSVPSGASEGGTTGNYRRMTGAPFSVQAKEGEGNTFRREVSGETPATGRRIKSRKIFGTGVRPRKGGRGVKSPRKNKKPEINFVVKESFLSRLMGVL